MKAPRRRVEETSSVSSVWSTSLLAPAAGDSGDRERDDGDGGDEGVVVVVGRFDSAEAGDSDGGGGSWCVGRERGMRLWRTLSIVASTERVCRRSAAIDSDGT